MLDHLGLSVSNFQASKQFYEAALAPLDYGVLFEFGGAAAGLGVGGKPDFWISEGTPAASIHIAFASPDRETVDAFHAAALAAGASDNGAPGLRPEYHPDYYAAFVLDPDGNNLEVVCHAPI
jgi:catechol 2,3-dioxygenase-like lactoylglutathione lyase family enzyme